MAYKLSRAILDINRRRGLDSTNRRDEKVELSLPAVLDIFSPITSNRGELVLMMLAL
jgi:hypothetical protein